MEASQQLNTAQLLSVYGEQLIIRTAFCPTCPDVAPSFGTGQIFCCNSLSSRALILNQQDGSRWFRIKRELGVVTKDLSSSSRCAVCQTSVRTHRRSNSGAESSSSSSSMLKRPSPFLFQPPSELLRGGRADRSKRSQISTSILLRPASCICINCWNSL